MSRELPEGYDGPWKVGNEYLPYHPSASHVPPDLRDCWNRCYWAGQEAVRLEREAILAVIEDLEEPAWYGYENPNNFDDGKRAAMAAIRARSQEGMSDN